jgi:acyl-CoA synthetase (AMP-forming)/AMP-acid ligase II
MSRVTSTATADVHYYAVDGTPVPAPEHATVTASLRRWAYAQPERPFLTWCSVEGETQVLTYGELDQRSRLLAATLVGELGGHASRDAGLALVPGNDIPSVVAIFAALRAGIPCLLLAPTDPEPRLRSILARHSVAGVLRSPFLGEHVAGLAEAIPAASGPEVAVAGDEPGPWPASRPALLFGTSGSTAASKLVVQSHRALTSNAEAMRRHHRMGPGTTVMGGLPIHHVNGVHLTLVAPLHAGAHVVLPQELSPFAYPSLLDTHRPHIASVVPSLVEAVVARSRGWRPTARLRYFVSAAAPLSQSLAQRVGQVLGMRVVQGYGLSETTNFSTMVPVDLSDDAYRAVALDAAIPSVGPPVHGNEVAILAEDGTVLGPGEQGEICMRGHNVMDGYAERPDLTAEAFRGGWFHSGDLGYWTAGPAGKPFFHITGRSKNMAKVRGETVSLEEVERALLSIGSVVDAACVAVPHETWGEQIVALVVTAAPDLLALRRELGRRLPAAAVPTDWRRLDAIPRTATGKLQRPRLVELVTTEAIA